MASLMRRLTQRIASRLLFAFGEFASVVGASGSVVADLGDRCDVDGPVEPPVPRA